MWSLCAWVEITAVTRRSRSIDFTIFRPSWAASMMTHSLSSPTTQTLLSTSQLPRRGSNVPDVTTRSTRTPPADGAMDGIPVSLICVQVVSHQSTTTERSTSPRSILSNAASTSSSPIRSDTKASRSNRPWR